jgi:hypothetical protein
VYKPTAYSDEAGKSATRPKLSVEDVSVGTAASIRLQSQLNEIDIDGEETDFM